MKIFLYTLTILTIFVFQSCDFNDTELNYNEQLVVFASITAGLPILDTVLVSRTASVNEDVNYQSANVFNSVKSEFEAIAGIVEQAGNWTEV